MNTRGPAPKEIDWKLFNKLCEFQCTQREIADALGISVDTLERGCLRFFGMKLADVWEQKKGLGRARLRKIQWNLAPVSAGMAIFLGKQMLGQRNEPENDPVQLAIARAGISIERAVELILADGLRARSVGKRTFAEFCEVAGYPLPFEKQVEMMRFGFLEEKVPRILLGSRGYGKTDYLTILGAAFQIYLDQGFTVLLITKSTERNASILEEIRKACVANGVKFERANEKFIRVEGLLGKDHSVSAVTIKAKSLRGRHPELVIMDDPVTEDDVSEATRAHVERVYNEVLKLTQNVLIIGQPAHKFDLYGKLRELLKCLEVPHGTIPQLDHDLEAQRLAGVSEASISASYHLKVLSEGVNPFDKIRYCDTFGAGPAVAFIDPSHEGGDFTALSIVKGHGEGVKAVGFCWKKSWDHCLEDMLPHLIKYGVKKLAFETNGLGEQPLDILRKIFPGIGIVGRRSNTNKHSRILAAGTFAHMIHLSRESDRTYTDQVVKYEYKPKNDDAPDSLASCLMWVGLIRGKE